MAIVPATKLTICIMPEKREALLVMENSRFSKFSIVLFFLYSCQIFSKSIFFYGI
ncbi:hypothetical protein MXB_169 [Myxobolus squamalis]|nr:hypothetical protein MXB_169 [Myxobolus squamalis]